MKTHILPLIAVFFQTIAISQNWEEPVNVTTNGKSGFPDIAVTSDGVIHVVYMTGDPENEQHAWCEYTKSEDGGLTWTEPFNFVQNPSNISGIPSIECDNHNNIVVAYDASFDHIVTRTLINGVWGAKDTISFETPAPHNNLLTSDGEKIYCFWANYVIGFSRSYSYYRYYENGEWSEIFYPYDVNQSEVRTLQFTDIAFDSDKNIHAVGIYREWPNSDYKVLYAKTNNNMWVDYELFPPYMSVGWVSIDVDSQNNQHIAYRYWCNDAADTLSAIIYKNNISNEWETDTIDFDDSSQYYVYQILANSPETPSIIYKKKSYTDTANLISCSKLDNNWSETIIDKRDASLFFPRFYKKNGQYFGVYQDQDFNIKLIRSGNNNSIAEQGYNQYNVEINCFPNPVQNKLKVEFNIPEKQNNAILTVLDLSGNKYMVQNIATLFPHTTYTKSIHFSKLPQGIYIINIKTEKYNYTEKIIHVNNY